MEKLLIIYEKAKTDKEMNRLIVVNPNKKLDNGNNEVIKILIGDFADEVYKQLTDTKQ